MSDLNDAPYATPVRAIVTRVPAEALPVGPPASPAPVPPGVQSPQEPMPHCRPDGMAIASTICGFTAIVPIVAQVIGLVLGIVSLARIRRARRRGTQRSGTKWAVTGILSSSFTLLGWVGMLVLLNRLSTSLGHTAGSLNGILQQVSAGG